MKTSVSANMRCVPRKNMVSGGPKAATYMWYSDIAIETSVTTHSSAFAVGSVAIFSSETSGVGELSLMK
jgi:hypothetical protein